MTGSQDWIEKLATRLQEHGLMWKVTFSNGAVFEISAPDEDGARARAEKTGPFAATITQVEKLS